MSEFTIRVEAPEIVKAINNLCAVLKGNRVEQLEFDFSKQPELQAQEAANVQISTTAEVPTYTLEQVRAMFAKKGKVDVNKTKAIIKQHGYEKLTDVPQEAYAAIMADLEAV